MAEVADAVTTVTSTVPGEPEFGLVAVIDPSMLTVKPVAAIPPKSTSVALAKSVPVIVIVSRHCCFPTWG